MILSMMSPLLPDEIVTDILSRLPVKCLLRSRCVSKFWLALITSPYFIKLHLNRSVQTKDNLSLFMWDEYLCRLNFDFIDDHDLPPTIVDYSPFRFKDGSILHGTSNGLVCMSTSMDIFYIWNPSTRKSIQLPFSPLQMTEHPDIFQEHTCGFGYNRINDDYKVVRLVVFKTDVNGDFINFEIEVYSLKTNLWHKPEKFRHYPNSCGTSDSIAGGAMHWISTIPTVESQLERKSLIVAFDMGTEKYRIIPHPKYNPGPLSCLYLNTLGGCLSVSCHYCSMNVDVYVLKEYGGKNEHWTKIITLPPSCFSDPFHMVKTIAYSKCGKKVLLNIDFECLVWYNLEQQALEEGVRELECIRDHDTDQIFEVVTCLESLVSFNVPEAEKFPIKGFQVGSRDDCKMTALAMNLGNVRYGNLRAQRLILSWDETIFFSYKVGDFGIDHMGNNDQAKMVRIGNVCVEMVNDTTYVLKEVKHIPDIYFNLLSVGRLDDEDFYNSFSDWE
ncbi:F-box protein CPR1-like [Impatiens glandulifera]|uniref:F-box protein CPR1-like n=1 Tax=Impatiens glandulifera TaxID=253017 RepID=UPI001FB0E0A3|nr:F-box protein CPR1-like [Impatiens glandulifera]